MTERVARKLDLRGKLLLGVAAMAAMAAPFAFGQSQAAQSGAGSQPPNEPSQPITFEVSSVKLNKSGLRPSAFGFGGSGDRFKAQNTSLLQLIVLAYGIGFFSQDRVIGAPDWLKSDRYDIEAKVADADVDRLHKLSPEEQMLLLQPLLVDRFKLQVHRETRLLPVYALVIAKNGFKLKESDPKNTYASGIKGADGVARPGSVMLRPGQITFQADPISQLAQLLSMQVGRKVVDKTGLTGKYDFKLQWTPDEAPVSISASSQGPGGQQSSPSDSSGPSIFTALQEQLGLKLEPQKDPVEMLVIDHVERPSEN